jgi:hypothetical protein
MIAPLAGQPKLSVPSNQWDTLTIDDRAEFCALCRAFGRDQFTLSRDPRVITFPADLVRILKFIDRSPNRIEARAMCAGICFLGPLICLNTRQLKGIMGRCKSSINGLLQQLGYVTLRTRATTRFCLIRALPILAQYPAYMRQWTVRHVSEACTICFVSRFGPSTAVAVGLQSLVAEDGPPVPEMPVGHLVLQFEALVSEPPDTMHQ